MSPNTLVTSTDKGHFFQRVPSPRPQLPAGRPLLCLPKKLTSELTGDGSQVASSQRGPLCPPHPTPRGRTGQGKAPSLGSLTGPALSCRILQGTLYRTLGRVTQHPRASSWSQKHTEHPLNPSLLPLVSLGYVQARGWLLSPPKSPNSKAYRLALIAGPTAPPGGQPCPKPWLPQGVGCNLGTAGSGSLANP